MIYFTNGCFDLLHVGHIDFLQKMYEQASDYAETNACPRPKIVVGINSDESVKRLKGSRRPYISDLHRKIMVESLKYVDKAIIFDEDTAESLINLLMPNVYFKGHDYSGRKSPEMAVVESYGGECRCISRPRLELRVQHTTQIVNSIFHREFYYRKELLSPWEMREQFKKEYQPRWTENQPG